MSEDPAYCEQHYSPTKTGWFGPSELLLCTWGKSSWGAYMSLWGAYMSLWHKLATLMVYVTEFCIAEAQMASQATPSYGRSGDCSLYLNLVMLDVTQT